MTRETPEGSRKLHMNMHFDLEYFASGLISQSGICMISVMLIQFQI